MNSTELSLHQFPYFHRVIMANKKSEEEKRKRKTELQRQRRLKTRNNPELHEKEKAQERERWRRRIEQGKIKTINDLSRREKKVKRNMWRQSSRKYREKIHNRERATNKFVMENTPPPSPATVQERHSASRKEVGRKKVRRDRSRAYRKIHDLTQKVHRLTKNLSKIKTRYYRHIRKTKIMRNTPNSKVKQYIGKCKVPEEVKRKLLFNEVLTTQIAENLGNVTNKRDRLIARKILSGDIIKKYKMKGNMKFLSYKEQRVKKLRIRKSKMSELRESVRIFLEKDEASRMCPGKRDTITRGGIKKQKRLLNKTLKSLHKDFIAVHNFPVSYALFCKLRPFWIVHPTINSRDTCLCTLCENIQLIVQKLFLLEMIEDNSAEKLYKRICCVPEKENCLERTCPNCSNKNIVFKYFSPEDKITYQRWIQKTETVMVSGKPKECKKTLKTKLFGSKQELVDLLTKTFFTYMQHICNRNHQYRYLDELKKNLPQNQIIIHMDFSENYLCKYNREIQSMHFGGSKEQVVLHTVVTYHNNGERVLQRSFCTLSESPRKDPFAIVAHLKPIINDASSLIPHLTKVHFVSDGPSTQYRNFKMFYLFGLEFPKILPNVLSLSWNYSERGHGKGAPDGVGGCLKRVADMHVAQGGDLPNVKSLCDALNERVKNIKVIHISSKEITEIIMPEKMNRFKGTLRTHQITWQRGQNVLYFRRLSCFSCESDKICQHYGIGILHLHNVKEKNCILSVIVDFFLYLCSNFLPIDIAYKFLNLC